MPIGGGGQPHLLTEGMVPFWSRDGNWIYFVLGFPASPQIWKMSPGGGQPIQVTRNGGFQPKESPDGKFLYYGKDYRLLGLWRVPVAGGEETHVLDIQGDWSLYTLTGEDIYYIAGTLPGQLSPHASIESFRPATGARKHIATIEKPLRTDLSVPVGPPN